MRLPVGWWPRSERRAGVLLLHLGPPAPSVARLRIRTLLRKRHISVLCPQKSIPSLGGVHSWQAAIKPSSSCCGVVGPSEWPASAPCGVSRPWRHTIFASGVLQGCRCWPPASENASADHPGTLRVSVGRSWIRSHHLSLLTSRRICRD